MNKELIINIIDDPAIDRNGRNSLFPIFLKLEETSLLVVEGEEEALQELTLVLHNSPSANIRIVSNVVKDVDIVIATTNERWLNEQISKDSKAYGKQIHVEDRPDLSDFYFVSIAKSNNTKKLPRMRQLR